MTISHTRLIACGSIAILALAVSGCAGGEVSVPSNSPTAVVAPSHIDPNSTAEARSEIASQFTVVQTGVLMLNEALEADDPERSNGAKVSEGFSTAFQGVTNSLTSFHYLMRNGSESPELVAYGKALDQCTKDLDTFSASYFTTEPHGVDAAAANVDQCADNLNKSITDLT